MTNRCLILSRTSSYEEPTVNLTPLIDVVFVILIMFIVIAPLLELDQIELAESPPAATESIASVQENSPITIHVQADDAIWFNNRLASLAELSLLLKQAKSEFPAAHPQLIHDKRARFGTYQAVKNSVEAAGFSRMDLILKTP